MRRRRGISTLTVTALVVALVSLGGAGRAQEPGPSSGPGASAADEGAAGPDRGVWRVVDLGEGTWRAEWRSPARLPFGSDRPTIVDDEGALGVTQVGEDGRTVSVVVTADEAPDPDTLDVVLSGDRLDVAGRDQVAAPAVPVTAPVTEALDADPGVPGPYATVSSDYELDPVKIRGMREPIEMVGRVVEPDPAAATGPRPLVLFLHGRHSYCYDPETGDDGWEWPCTGRFEEIPSHLGYRYVQRLLASQGYATVSVRVNGINAQDWRLSDGGAQARARIVQRHLDHWVTLAAGHQVDLSRVVLVGHSRGGEGVDRASIRIPLSAPYRVVGQVLIAPTDFGTQTAPYVPTTTLLPYCDGDVIDLQGQRYTDTSRDLAADDTSLKSSVMVMGANHNFFNTEWTPRISAARSFDDWWGDPEAACGRLTADRLSAFEQRQVGKAYIAGAVALFANAADEYLPMYDGTAVSVASAGDADVRTHALGGGRAPRRPVTDSALSTPAGAVTQFCLGQVSEGSPGACGRARNMFASAPHWPWSGEAVPKRRAFEMTWDAAGEVGGLELAQPLDVSGGRLELRTVVDPTLGNVRLRVRLTDDVGTSVDATPVGGTLLPALLKGSGLSKRWAQSLLVDTSALAGIDLTAIVKVELVGLSADGRVWVLDLSTTPAALAPVPVKRAPVISLGALRIDEGDGPGEATAEVPFTVRGTVVEPARLRVYVVGDRLRDRQTHLIDLVPGQTAGTVPVSYEPDNRDDLAESTRFLVAHAERGAMTDAYLGTLTIVDDDPTPAITVRAADRSLVEGRTARVRVRLAAPVDYHVYVFAGFANAREPELRGTDLPLPWWRRHSEGDRRDVALSRAQAYVGGKLLRPGDTRVVFEVPILDDRRTEPREWMAIRVNMYLGEEERSVTRTFRVARSD